MMTVHRAKGLDFPIEHQRHPARPGRALRYSPGALDAVHGRAARHPRSHIVGRREGRHH
jgi:hypothetical protein